MVEALIIIILLPLAVVVAGLVLSSLFSFWHYILAGLLITTGAVAFFLGHFWWGMGLFLIGGIVGALFQDPQANQPYQLEEDEEA